MNSNLEEYKKKLKTSSLKELKKEDVLLKNNFNFYNKIKEEKGIKVSSWRFQDAESNIKEILKKKEILVEVFNNKKNN